MLGALVGCGTIFLILSIIAALNGDTSGIEAIFKLFAFLFIFFTVGSLFVACTGGM